MSRWLPVHVYVAVEGELVDIVVDANSVADKVIRHCIGTDEAYDMGV